MDGGKVRVARLVLGREHEIQVQSISAHYGVVLKEILNATWDEKSYETSKRKSHFPFQFEHLPVVLPAWGKEKDEPSWQEAYYHVMDCLIPLRLEAIHQAMGRQCIKIIIVDSAF